MTLTGDAAKASGANQARAESRHQVGRGRGADTRSDAGQDPGTRSEPGQAEPGHEEESAQRTEPTRTATQDRGEAGRGSRASPRHAERPGIRAEPEHDMRTVARGGTPGTRREARQRLGTRTEARVRLRHADRDQGRSPRHEVGKQSQCGVQEHGRSEVGAKPRHKERHGPREARSEPKHDG